MCTQAEAYFVDVKRCGCWCVQALEELHKQSEESESAPVALIFKGGYLYDSS